MIDAFLSGILFYEPTIRLVALVGVLGAMTAWEFLAPRRPLSQRWQRRWLVNLSIMLADGALLRLVFPAAAVGIAVLAQSRGWGLFNSLALPPWSEILLAVLLLDLTLYGQHVAAHKIPVFWRLHRMHHSDLDIDVTTGVRFHPFEILLSMLLKGGAILALGAHPAAVLIFEVLLNVSSLFNHGNVRMPREIDRALRLFVVTPDMHRVHHSIVRIETDSNYGFCLPWWDRLFRTYRGQPRAGHDGMTIGIPAFRDSADQGLWALLAQPFRRAPPLVTA